MKALAPTRRMHIDIETFSTVDLSGQGLAPYAENCELLLIAYAFDDEPVKLWDVSTGDPYPADLVEGLRDPEVVKWAWNARFEVEVLKHTFPLVEGHWRDTMYLATSAALPAHLGGAGKAVELDEEHLKMDEGKSLIKKFCVPRVPTKTKPWDRCTSLTDPDDWRRFGHYCVRDVEAERAIWHKLAPFNPPDHEWDLMRLDWKINRQGMPIDLELVRAAVALDEAEKERLRGKLNALTGLENGNSTTQLMPWLRARGYDRDSLAKESVKLFVRKTPDADPKIIEALKLRAQISSTSVAKYKKIEEMAQASDDWWWLPNGFQFRGAGRTGRWAGRGVQWQNAARPKWSDTEELVQLIKAGSEHIEWMYGPVTSCLSGCLRSAVRAPAGKVLHIVDFGAIEVWMAEWLTGCAALRAVREQGKDPYKAFGEVFLGKPHDDISKPERNLMKPVVLGGGYGLGGGEEQEDGTRTGLMGYGASMGVMLDQDVAQEQVRVYREMHPEIVEQWYDLERAFMDATESAPGFAVRVGKVVILRTEEAVRIRLPSGRCLNYYQPELREMAMPWKDKTTGLPATKVCPTFMAVDQMTKRFFRMPTRGARLFENCDQAISSDVLAVALTRLDAAGFTIVGHVHDEIICMQDNNDEEHSLHRMEQIMTQPIDWAPGLHLIVEGGSSRHWRKY